MPLTAKQLLGNQVRVPEPVQGEVTVISRYGKERAMVIHPNDSHQVAAPGSDFCACAHGQRMRKTENMPALAAGNTSFSTLPPT